MFLRNDVYCIPGKILTYKAKEPTRIAQSSQYYSKLDFDIGHATFGPLPKAKRAPHVSVLCHVSGTVFIEFLAKFC